jgi:hypothetical protein
VRPRITFNGKEYSSPEAMPEDARKAYFEALAGLRDADSYGIPDVFEAGSGDAIISVQQSSITFKGKTVQTTELPWWARRLVGASLGEHSVADPGREPRSAGSETSGGLDAAQRTLGPMLAFMAGFVLVFAIALIFTIGGGQKHLAGRLSVAIPALLLLGWLDSYATQVAKRREPLLGPDSPGYRQFVVWSSLGLLLSAVVLLGLACYLPA